MKRIKLLSSSSLRAFSNRHSTVQIMSVCGRGWNGRASDGRIASAFASIDLEHDTRTIDLRNSKLPIKSSEKGYLWARRYTTISTDIFGLIISSIRATEKSNRSRREYGRALTNGYPEGSAFTLFPSRVTDIYIPSIRSSSCDESLTQHRVGVWSLIEVWRSAATIRLEQYRSDDSTGCIEMATARRPLPSCPASWERAMEANRHRSLIPSQR